MAGRLDNLRGPQHRPVEGARAGPRRRCRRRPRGRRRARSRPAPGGGTGRRRPRRWRSPPRARSSTWPTRPTTASSSSRTSATSTSRPRASAASSRGSTPRPTSASPMPPGGGKDWMRTRTGRALLGRRLVLRAARQRAQVPHPAHERHAQAGRLPALGVLRLAADGRAAHLVRFCQPKPHTLALRLGPCFANRVSLAGGSTLCASARTRP